MQSETVLAVLWLCAGITAAVFAAMLATLLTHRYHTSRDSQFHRSGVEELVWNLIPVALVILLAAPAIIDLRPDLANSGLATPAVPTVGQKG